MGTTIDTKFTKFMKVKNFLPVNEQKSIKKFVIHVSQNVIRKIGDSTQAHTNENYGHQIANPAAARVGKEYIKKLGARGAQEFLRQ